MAIRTKEQPNEIISILLVVITSLLLLFIFQGTVFASDANTKVVVEGNWINTENRETVVILTDTLTGQSYNGILEYGKKLIFKNISYGTYKITCESTLDLEYERIGIQNNEFTLVPDGEEQVVERITVTNKLIQKGGFYNIRGK